ncbi:DNA-directed RNA polymerase 2A-like isoform X2 [Camellia sinensis]|uniref:DNA-directed RNA polymerase 2A-like isoform X2 n=1 Tax=Camellia sinensis TaxID=4442 RepID=UPI0010367EEB|nr:DNA-directed RNA polymerase 2A-like isoform X2 [Camellia sinensis]
MPVHQDGSCNGLQYYATLGRDKVDRKLVKQTVMKSLYGMTCIGAHDQIKKRLKDRCAIEDEDELFAASCYATKVNTYRYSHLDRIG